MSEEEIEKLTDENLRTEEFKKARKGERKIQKRRKEEEEADDEEDDEKEEEEEEEGEKVQLSTHSMLLAIQQGRKGFEQRNKEKGRILSELISNLRTKIESKSDQDDREDKAIFKKQIEVYQIELRHYETGLEIELAENGLNKTSKMDLVKENFVKERIDERVLPVKSRFELVKTMGQDLESIDQELDPFQEELLKEAKKLNIDQAQIKEKKFDILKNMTKGLEARFGKMNQLARRDSQKDILNQIANIYHETGKLDVEQAFKSEFDLIDEDVDKELARNRSHPDFLSGLADQIMENRLPE
uniref:Uncharacterized protein n=1 Tax=Ditylenchus dipsaci TaxID=166011 RepID=A0A915DE36_9BILA